MNTQFIESIANAVLYEGYMLYPYRPSATKNRQRWNFGVVYPKSFSEAQKGSDPCLMQTQCLAVGSEDALVEVKVRFLQTVSREIGKPAIPSLTAGPKSELTYDVVDLLEIGDRVLRPWEETIEREIVSPAMRIADLASASAREEIALSYEREVQRLDDESGAAVAFVVHTREALKGAVEISAVRCGADCSRVTVVVSNLSIGDDSEGFSREKVLRQSFLSTHTILGISGAEFVSLLDPAPLLRDAAAECKNIGTWPVLAGNEDARNMMLSSPIILYDYPQIAPESPGNLFDGTEIDEILSLRIMALSDDEKREIYQADDRTRELLARTDALPDEHLMKLHGAVRGLKRAGEERHDGDRS